uniref:Retrovirus-related Pol polyprotein from transposon TNT 1-94-like beta-barrel domain-containing protein n=1 Tax=Tanacetum cinerariifolium TaxID=118510 RepID=A0A699GXL4_TANCI|nr:hypothetical protein [Tanacetum cinerariifolium]
MGRGYDRGQEAKQKQVKIIKDKRDKVQAEYHVLELQPEGPLLESVSKLVASRDKEVNMAARDSDDALVFYVENTVKDLIMDSGASFHATYCKKELERFKLHSGKVCLADDKTLDIANVRDVILKTSFGTSWTLKDVRVVYSKGGMAREGYKSHTLKAAQMKCDTAFRIRRVTMLSKAETSHLWTRFMKLENDSLVVKHGLSSEITQSPGGSSDMSDESKNSGSFEDSKISDEEYSEYGASSKEEGSDSIFGLPAGKKASQSLWMFRVQEEQDENKSFDQPTQTSIDHQPPKEMSVRELLLQEKLHKALQAVCEKLIQQKQVANIDQTPLHEMSIQDIEDLKQHYIDEMECEDKIDELKGKFNGMSIEINKKKELHYLEQVANINTYPSRRFRSFCYDDNDDDYDYKESTIPLNEIESQEPLSNAITPILPTFKDLDDSLIMGNEDRSTNPEKESNEFIKSSVEDLDPIPSESEDTSGSDNECDLSLCENNSMSGNPTPYSNFEVESLSPAPIPYEDSDPLLKETDILLSYFDNYLPKYETFSFDIEEKSSDSTTTHSDYSLPDYDVFYFDDDHIEEKSSGNTTTHSDCSLPEYDSFIFYLSIDPFPPADRSVSHHEEFADELTHIISSPEYDCFYFNTETGSGELTILLEENVSKYSTKEFTSPELNDFHLLLSDCDFTFSKEFSENDLLVSFPSGNKDKVFDPGIFIIKRVQSKRFHIFPLDDFPTFSFVVDSLLLIDPSEIKTFLSFPFGNKDKVFDPGIFFINGVFSFYKKNSTSSE